MLLGACGIDCSECEEYRATQAGDAEWMARIVENWRKLYGGDPQPEDHWCEGCMTGGRLARHCAGCDIRACAVARSLAHCAGCADYACEKLARIFTAPPVGNHSLQQDAKKRLDSLRD